MTGQRPGARTSDAESKTDNIYLDIRSRILNGQFLPDQVVECFAVVAHFTINRSIADQALEALAADGYLRQTIRGGYVVRRYAPGEIEDMLILQRKIANAGVRSLIRDPDSSLSNQLKKIVSWKANFKNLGPNEIETFTQKTRSFQSVLLSRATVASTMLPLKTLTAPALHRQVIRCMTYEDMGCVWSSLNQTTSGILTGDLVKAQEPRLSTQPFEQTLVEMTTQLNALIATPTADFGLSSPQFHVLFENTPGRPYFGLGGRDL
jgi:DNA-binding GntR family transcriptional regulator